LAAGPGETINLQVAATDPDTNKVSVKWWQYFEVDSYEGKIEIKDPSASSSSFVVPHDAKKEIPFT
jgi:hypothetical protein